MVFNSSAKRNFASVNRGFGSAGYNSITATTMAANQASRRVMEKIGMNYTRTVPVDFPNPFQVASKERSGTS